MLNDPTCLLCLLVPIPVSVALHQWHSINGFSCILGVLTLFIGLASALWSHSRKQPVKNGKFELLESLVFAIPQSPTRARAARDFVRFYTAPKPLLFIATGRASSPSSSTEDADSNNRVSRRRKWIPLRAELPLPNGDFRPDVVTTHYNNFRDQVLTEVKRAGLALSDAAWGELMRNLSVNMLIEMMLAGRFDTEDTAYAAWPAHPKDSFSFISNDDGPKKLSRTVTHEEKHESWHGSFHRSQLKIINLKSPCFVIVISEPCGSFMGSVRVVTYARAVSSAVEKRQALLRVSSQNLCNILDDSIPAPPISPSSCSDVKEVSTNCNLESIHPNEKKYSKWNKEEKHRLLKKEVLYLSTSNVLVENFARDRIDDLFVHQRPEVVLGLIEALKHRLSRDLIYLITHYLDVSRFYGPRYLL
mmetsp:Transcript_314/g.418  ORF Transcript_314/g.418 Transcript_314/m.418 type:complete len:417 (+) Transcript_314:89-1339(+)